MFGLNNELSLVFFLLFMGIINVMKVSREDNVKLKRVALEWSLATLLGALVLWGAFDLEGQFQIINRIEWVISPGLNFQWGPGFFALDGASLFFFVLTTLLIPICILIS